MIKKFIILFLFCNLAYGQVVIDSYKYVATATQDPNDKYPLGQADSWNDILSIGSWVNQGNGIVTTEAVSGHGNVITITSNSTTSSQGGSMAFTADGTSTYDVTISYKVVSAISSTQAFRAWLGVATSPDFTMSTDGLWHDETFTVVSNLSIMTIKAYSTRVAASGANKVQIKLITAIKQ